MIIREKIRADQNPYCNTFSGEITYDYVFLLSVSEVVDIFKNKADRIASGTEYSLELYDMNLKKTNRNIAWWLRTPGKYLDSAAVVSSIVSKYDDTMSFSVGFNVNKKLGVRPAIWVDIS